MNDPVSDGSMNRNENKPACFYRQNEGGAIVSGKSAELAS